MRRFLAFALAAALAFSLTGCMCLSFDPEAQAVVDVVTVSDFDISYYDDIYYSSNDPDYDFEPRQSGDKKYYAIGNPLRMLNHDCIKEISAFEPDDADFYTVVSGGIIDTDDDYGNRVYKAVDKSLFDEKGSAVEMTGELSDVFDSILSLEPHDMFLCQIIRDGGEYFVYTELNVNWWYPCELYYYDKSSRSLTMLCQFDNERIVGIKIRDLSLINNTNIQ